MPRSGYSEEIQEIMGRIPNWVVRWGLSVVFILFMVVLGISCFFKYPEVITAPIVLTTLHPPADLMARSTGKIEYLLVDNGDRLLQGDVVAVLFNTTDYRQVLDLERQLADSSFSLGAEVNRIQEREAMQLGELQSFYSGFVKECKSYDHYLKSEAVLLQKQQIERQIEMLHQKQYTQKQQLVILKKDLEFERNNIKRDSILYNVKALAEAEFEKSQQNLLQKELSVANQENVLVSTQSTIIDLENQLMNMTFQYDDQVHDYLLQINERREQLLAQIKLWKEQYVLLAPIDGMIAFTNYWSENQNIKEGDRLATVIPDDSVRIIGRMTIPSSGLGKVKIGQQVNIKLNGFPYMEYGLLKGYLSSISAIPEETGYVAEVVLPKGLLSSYQTRFQFIQQMDGVGEIVTKDTRLIERFIRPIESLFKNN